MFKRKLNQIILHFSKIFLKIFLKFNSPNLSSLILLINLRRIKGIYNHKINKKVLVLAKSGGYEDLVETFSKTNRNADWPIPNAN